jgi:ribosomal protein S4
MPTSKKAKLLKIRQTRAEAGKLTVFRDAGSNKSVDEKQLRRYLKESMRRDTATMHARLPSPMDLKALTGSSFTFGSSM